MAKKVQLDEVRPVLDATNKVIDAVEEKLDILDKVVDHGTDVVESGLDKVADVVPEIIDTSVHVSTKGTRKVLEALRRPKVQAFTVIGVSMAFGAGLGVAGYFALKRQLETKLRKEYDEKFDSEVEEMRLHYARITKSGAFSSPETAVEELLTKEAATTLRNYGNRTVDIPGEPSVVDIRAGEVTDAELVDDPDFEERPEVDVTALRERMRRGPVSVEERGENIFVDGHPLTGEDDWDQEEIDRARAEGEPHVISQAEFMENPDDWTTTELTYYNGDDTLADDQDSPVPDIEEIVGSENLSKFGHGSGDRNVVYVRNPKIEVLFEITYHSGEYAKEVAGLTHSAPVGLRRFRDHDE